MAKDFKLTRTEAEYLVDLLTAQDNDGMANELGEQLRKMFGMISKESEIANNLRNSQNGRTNNLYSRYS